MMSQMFWALNKERMVLWSSTRGQDLLLQTTGNLAHEDDPSVIKIRGLPFQTTAMEVWRFFNDCAIVGGSNRIYFPLNERSRPTGEAFVEMETARDIDKALEKHKDCIWERWVMMVLLGM